MSQGAVSLMTATRGVMSLHEPQQSHSSNFTGLPQSAAYAQRLWLGSSRTWPALETKHKTDERRAGSLHRQDGRLTYDSPPGGFSHRAQA